MSEIDPNLTAALSRRFRLVRTLGAGGMGTVLLAEQIAVGNRPVALKVLNRRLLDDPEFLLRFQNEAASTGRIRHPNVVTIYESGQGEDGTPYIAMEYLEGGTLRHALKRTGAMPPAECAEILQQAARGLNAAHKLGIIHRDLKPDNLFLTRGDEGEVFVKVVDFGIAKLRESATHTLTGTVLGTPAYMSYEQASGMRSDELDARSDVYSLGVVAYEMLTGRVPFHSDTPLGFVRKHMLEEPPPFHEVSAGLPVSAQLEAVVMKALTKDRTHRYSHVLDFSREFVQAATAPPALEMLATTKVIETAYGARIREEQPAKAVAEQPASERAQAELKAEEGAKEEFHQRERAQAEQWAKETLETAPLPEPKAATAAPTPIQPQAPRPWRERSRFAGRMLAIFLTYYPISLVTWMATGVYFSQDSHWSSIRDWVEVTGTWVRLIRNFHDLRWKWWYPGWLVAPLGLAIGCFLCWCIFRWAARLRGEPKWPPGYRDKAVTLRMLPAISALISMAVLGTPLVPATEMSWPQALWSALGPLTLTLAASAWVAIWALRARGAKTVEITDPSKRPTRSLLSLKILLGGAVVLAVLAAGLRLWWAHQTHAAGVLEGHTFAVHAIAFSPNGDELVSGGYDATVRVWAIPSGRNLQTIRVNRVVSSVAFSPGGNLIAAAGTGGLRSIWDPSTGNLVRELDPADPTDACCVAFSPDGHLIAAASYGYWVRLWDASTGRLVRIMNLHSHWVESLAFSPDGQWIAIGGGDGLREVREVNTGHLVRTLDPADNTDATCVAFSPDGQWVAASSYRNWVRVWEVKTGHLIQIVKSGDRIVSSFAFSADGRLLATFEGRDVELWDVGTGQLMHTLTGHSWPVESLAFAPRGGYFASGSEDTTIRLWRW